MSLAHAIRAAGVVVADDIAVPKREALWSVSFLQSPSFRVLTRSAHLILAKIIIERASGHAAITHRDFTQYGINRDCITHAIAELEALGIVRVERRTPHANAYDLSLGWRGITSIEQAVAIRDRARHFGLTRRRKIERATARIRRRVSTGGAR